MTEVKPNVAGLAVLAVSSVALGGVLAAAVGLLRQPPPAPAEGPRRRRERARGDDEDDDAEPSRAQKASQAASRRSAAAEQFDGCGFSMEEALKMADLEHDKVKSLSPPEVLAQLQRGNARFWTGTAHRPETTAFQRRALISKQFPTVAVVGCSDSRVPVEIVFDMGLGDIFVIRVAGNCLRLPNTPARAVDPCCISDSATLASLQYAVHHLKVKVVIVMGHEGCGAVKAAQLPPEAIRGEPQCLQNLLMGLRSGLNLDQLAKVRDAKAKDREAIIGNVKRQVESLAEDGPIMEKVLAGEVMVIGAFYEISSGIVDFFHEVSNVGGGQPAGIERKPSRGVLSRLEPQPRLPSEEGS